jgi:hypothetical protein
MQSGIVQYNKKSDEVEKTLQEMFDLIIQGANDLEWMTSRIK